MSVFEIIMLLCFGIAWPFSIYKSYTSRQTQGKSVVFLMVIVIGYLSGIIHKLLYNKDWVVLLYMLNLIMVSTDIALFFRNRRLEKRKNDLQ